MMNDYITGIGLPDPPSQLFGTIDRAMLPTGTTKGHLEMTEITFDKSIYMMIHKGINGIQER